MSVQGDGDDATQGSSHDESPTVTDEEQDNELVKLEDGKILEVKCGPLRAKMHVELFLCPGIHQQCIELNGEMISPKEFTVRANKDKQKDWKGSIRIGKSNLRTLMELRSFDFFNHLHYCSAKCQSRNYITPKSERVNQEGSEREHRRSSVKSSIEQFMAIHNHAQHSPFTVLKPDSTPDSLSHLVQMSTVMNNNNTHHPGLPIPHHNHPMMPQSEDIVDIEETIVRVQPTNEQVHKMMHSEPTTFWTQMQDLGVLDEIVDTLVHEVDTVRNETRVHNITPRVCNTLSRLCAALDMNDSVAARVRSRQPQEPSFQSVPEIGHCDDRKRRLEDRVPMMPIPHMACLPPEVKRPRTQYPPVMQSPLIEALIKAQSTYQMHQSAPFANMDLLLKFASQPPPQMAAPVIESSSLPSAFNSQITEALLKMQ